MDDTRTNPASSEAPTPREQPTATEPTKHHPEALPKEIGGAPGPEPTRYGDWERNGRCSDF